MTILVYKDGTLNSTHTLDDLNDVNIQGNSLRIKNVEILQEHDLQTLTHIFKQIEISFMFAPKGVASLRLSSEGVFI